MQVGLDSSEKATQLLRPVGEPIRSVHSDCRFATSVRLCDSASVDRPRSGKPFAQPCWLPRIRIGVCPPLRKSTFVPSHASTKPNRRMFTSGQTRLGCSVGVRTLSDPGKADTRLSSSCKGSHHAPSHYRRRARATAGQRPRAHCREGLRSRAGCQAVHTGCTCDLAACRTRSFRRGTQPGDSATLVSAGPSWARCTCRTWRPLSAHAIDRFCAIGLSARRDRCRTTRTRRDSAVRFSIDRCRCGPAKRRPRQRFVSTSVLVETRLASIAIVAWWDAGQTKTVAMTTPM